MGKKKIETAVPSVNKAELVREAVKDLGNESSSKTVGEFIKAKHGAETFAIIEPMLSNYVSQERKRQGIASTRAVKGVAAAHMPTKSAPMGLEAALSTLEAHAAQLRDIDPEQLESILELVSKIGVEGLKSSLRVMKALSGK